MDEVDLQILAILQEDARIPTAEVARQIDMAASAVHARIGKLEEMGVIESYEARLSPAALDLGLLAFIFVKTDEQVGAVGTADELSGLAEVQEVHHVAGEDCILAKVRTADNAALGRFLREKLGRIPRITSTETVIVLESVKETARLPMERPSGARG